MNNLPFAPPSPEPVPPALEVFASTDFLPDPSPQWLTKELLRFHSRATFDKSRSHLQRSFHATQARLLRKKLSGVKPAPFNWQNLCREAFQSAQKPPIPLT